MQQLDVDVKALEEGSDAPCIVQDFGPVRLIIMNQPRRRNALSLIMREALEKVLGEAAEAESVRAIVLAGAGGAFSAGGDITTMNELTPVAGRPRMHRVHGLFRQLYHGPKPVVAAVEGAAVGAGLSLATACDIIVSSDNARFGAPFNKIGVMPDVGLLFTLPGRIGLGKTRMLALTGKIIDAPVAERWGLADEIVPAGTAVQAALNMAALIAEGAPLAQMMTKQMLSRLPLSSEELLSAEADAQSVLFSTADFAEGRTAFLEKRKPVFSGT